MKKLIALLLMAAFAVSLFAACGKTDTGATLPEASYSEDETAPAYRGYEYAATLTCSVSYVLYMDEKGNVVKQSFIEDTTGELGTTEISDPKIEMTGMLLKDAAAKFAKEMIGMKLLENDGFVFITITECYNEKVDVFAEATACVDAIQAEAKAAGLNIRVQKTVSEDAILAEEDPDATAAENENIPAETTPAEPNVGGETQTEARPESEEGPSDDKDSLGG